MRYAVLPSGRCSLSSLVVFRTPVRNARQLCSFQPVALMISATVAPVPRESNFLTLAFFDCFFACLAMLDLHSCQHRCWHRPKPRTSAAKCGVTDDQRRTLTNALF